MRTSPSIDMVRKAANALGPLRDRVVFLGGAVLDLLLTDPAAPQTRGTEDVDVIVEAATNVEYAQIEGELRKLGFQHDMTSNVLCRWNLRDLTLDVMPTEESILGFSNPWYRSAIENSVTIDLEGGASIQVVDAPHFLATKLAAFDNPGREGNGDYLASRDMSDIVGLIDGRPELVAEVSESSPAIKDFLRTRCQSLTADRGFGEGITSHLPPDPASQGRSAILMERVRAIAESAD